MFYLRQKKPKIGQRKNLDQQSTFNFLQASAAGTESWRPQGTSKAAEQNSHFYLFHHLSAYTLGADQQTFGFCLVARVHLDVDRIILLAHAQTN